LGTDISTTVDQAARLIVESSYVVALCGAGVSVESGVPTFRGPDGLWTRLGQPSTHSYQLFLADPAAWWKQYLSRDADPARAELRDAIASAEPNPAHLALVDLERMGVLRHTITQNVDGLHRKAGSSNLTEMHGNRTMNRCISCEARWPREEVVSGDYLPTCPFCAGLVKSDTVMFGEPVPRGVLARCREEVERSDCMLLVGTSATVMPAAMFPENVAARGGVLIEINPDPTVLSERADVVLRYPAGVAVPALTRRVGELLGR
jgi:NAD-dependent deacetylase